LNHTNAIIIDLWENRGGYSSMVSLIAACLFHHPEYIYDPRVNPTPHSSTLSPVAGVCTDFRLDYLRCGAVLRPEDTEKVVESRCGAVG
jgi:hypothetical protein